MACVAEEAVHTYAAAAFLAGRLAVENTSWSKLQGVAGMVVVAVVAVVVVGTREGSMVFAPCFFRSRVVSSLTV